MEMTKEERHAFFAQYYGQMIGFDKERAGYPHVLIGSGIILTDYIELRDVHQLTSDELIILGARCDYPMINIDSVRYADDGSGFYINFKHGYAQEFIYWTDLAQRPIDYLRSIGVLVGFRQFLSKTLIEIGVVKIKK